MEASPSPEPSPVVPSQISLPIPIPTAAKPKKRNTGERMAPARAYAIRALVESGFNKREICKREHVSINTVNAIKNSPRFDPQRVDRIKQNLSAQWYDTGHRALNEISDQKLSESSALQLATVAAISTDKARLIEGKSTSRTEYVNAEDQAVNDEIARLEAEVGKWERGEVLNTEGLESEGTTSAGQLAPETIDEGAKGAP